MAGPFVAQYSTAHPSGKRASHLVRTWFTQKKPYKSPLPYQVVGGSTDNPDVDAWIQNQLFAGGGLITVDMPAAESRCFNNLLKQWKDLRGNAQIGTSLAEYSQSLDMISKRSTQLVSSFNALRKGRFGDAFKILGLRRKRYPRNLPPVKAQAMFESRLKQPPKVVGGWWLEYWLGWAPFVGDICSAIKVLERDPHASHRLVGKARTRATHVYGGEAGEFKSVAAVRCEANITVTNPNLELASRLGLTNPFLTAWDLVPLSFVFNWVIPVNRFFESFQDFLGCDLKASYTTRYYTVSGRSFGTYYTGFNLFRNPDEIVSAPSAFSYLHAGLPRLSVSRAATSVSLLLQQLQTKK